jgi:hypothetical protein
MGPRWSSLIASPSTSRILTPPPSCSWWPFAGLSSIASKGAEVAAENEADEGSRFGAVALLDIYVLSVLVAVGLRTGLTADRIERWTTATPFS